ncbi:MAG: histidine phosphatase family protein [Microbacterium sp.]
MTTLLLVRHGMTEWNRVQRMQGRSDIDLSEQGRADATALAEVVAAWKPQTLICSPLARAASTAALISDLPATVDDAWIEHGLGEWEGCTPDAIGPDYARWRAGEVIPPGGEREDEIRERITGAVRTAARRPGPVLVVTHGGTIRAVLNRFVGLAPGRLDPVAAPSLTVIDVIDDDVARLRSFNLTA